MQLRERNMVTCISTFSKQLSGNEGWDGDDDIGCKKVVEYLEPSNLIYQRLQRR